MMPADSDNSSSSTEDIQEGALEAASSVLGCAAIELATSKLSGDASSRCYFRLRRCDGESIVAAVYPEPFDETEPASRRLSRFESVNQLARLTFANDPCAHLEATEVLAKGELPVPKVLGVSGRERCVLLEDVGDLRLQDWLPNHTAEEQLAAYRNAIDYIVRIQELTASVADPETIYSRLAFDEAKLRFELDFFAENFFNRYLSTALDPNDRSEMDEAFTIICCRLAAFPRVLTHRDYHARNLMMDGGRMVIIDHQDARLGPETYDLVSLLDDPYAVLAADQSTELIDYYLERKSSSSVQLVQPAEFRESIHLAAVQRMLKAVGTYTYQAAVKYNEVYIRYIEPALVSGLKHLRALEAFPKLESILDESLELAAQ
ncbi:MAG TPA: phosphotransferase [Blastocatellia bacterium]|nr:phosphotransferase [Blastocatellia bacterium]